MLQCIILIISGCLAIPSLIISKKPDAKVLFDKISPYQGWLGLIILIWGLWSIISTLLHMKSMLGSSLILWILYFAIAIVEVLLGFIFSFNLINQYVFSKNEKSQEKAQQLLTKLLPLQGNLGIAAIILGIVSLVLILIL